MKITFIGHASILIETRGVRILSDPWWRGPCFGAQWWIYPPAHVEPLAEGVDFIYISHGHHDHLHPGTLRTLDRKATCLVSSRIGIAGIPRGLGFPVVELDDDTVHELAPGVRCRVIETHAEDTLFVVEDGERVCVNLNDALHAAPADVQDRFVGLLNKLYPRIDYVFCGYGVASHFPNCYEIPGKDREATAARRQAHFNRQWGRIVAALSPRYAFPFAADVAFLEDDLLWTNEPTRNAERPTGVFRTLHPGSSTTVVDIAPGFCIEDDTVVHNVLRQPLSLDRLRSECAESIERAVNVGTGTRAVFDEVLRLVSGNAERCLSYLREFAGDYRFMIRFRNFDRGIMVTKRGDSIVVAEGPADPETVADVTYVTRLNYLRWSLTSEHGHEILFVGSGGIFRYADANDARRNLHRELSVLLVPHAVAPASRFGNTSPVIHRWKRRIRRWLGRRPRDLYDLATWTVWSGTER
jgi:hypothetical protein